MNSKVGTDQAVGNTAWHADTGRERLQQGFHVIVCNVRPHLSLRLGTAAILPFFRSIIPSARVQPPCLLSLLFLKTVSEGGGNAWFAIASKGVTCDTSWDLNIAVLFRFLSQSRASIWVAGSVTLQKESRTITLLYLRVFQQITEISLVPLTVKTILQHNLFFTWLLTCYGGHSHIKGHDTQKWGYVSILLNLSNFSTTDLNESPFLVDQTSKTWC